MSTDGFPGAIWIPAHTDRYARRDSRVIDEIVLHITEVPSREWLELKLA